MTASAKRYVIRRIGRTGNMDHEVYERHEAYQLLSTTEKRMVVVEIDVTYKPIGQPRTVQKRSSDRFFLNAERAFAAAQSLNRIQNSMTRLIEGLLKNRQRLKADVIEKLEGTEQP